MIPHDERLKELLWSLTDHWIGEEKLLPHQVRCLSKVPKWTTFTNSSNWRQDEWTLNSKRVICLLIYLWGNRVTHYQMFMYKTIFVIFYFSSSLLFVQYWKVFLYWGGVAISHSFSVNLLLWLFHWKWTQNYRNYRLFVTAKSLFETNCWTKKLAEF